LREFLKSVMSFSWAMSLFGVRQMGSVAVGDTRVADSFDKVARAAQEQLDNSMKRAYGAGAGLQASGNSSVSAGLQASGPRAGSTAPPASTPSAPPQSKAQSSLPQSVTTRRANVQPGRLNRDVFIALGGGLSAGAGDFVLSEEFQSGSFPAQMAAQMGADFPQPLLEAPGIGNPTGFEQLPVIVPRPPQTTLLRDVPPKPVYNLSIPGFRIADTLALRPVQPLIHRDNAKQTLVNVTLGIIPISRGLDGQYPTQLEYAQKLRPTLALVELGYDEAIEAAATGKPELIPEPSRFAEDYRKVLADLRRTGAQLLALTVPDPLDTAWLSNIGAAERVLKLEPGLLEAMYTLKHDDLLTVTGLNEISFQLFARSVGPLPDNAVLPRPIANAITDRVARINSEIVRAAGEHNALVFDLCGLFRSVKRQGMPAGSRIFTGEYLGGFYSLNGYYPGKAGHAIIANQILAQLNQVFGSNFPAIDVNSVVPSDPIANYRAAGGRNWTQQDLELATSNVNSGDRLHANGPSVDFTGSASSHSDTAPLTAKTPKGPLRLPRSLEQVLPLNKDASYFGDGLSPLNCTNPRDIQWSSGGNYLFGGLAMVDSHLTGNIRITFTPPMDDITRFQIRFEGGFTGDDSLLVTPRYFKMGFQRNRVDEVPNLVSGGTLNLRTGEVSELQVYAAYGSTALMALVSVNPNFPKQPLTFPGQYGSAWALFEQRPDGNLDFTFYGSTFVPLGNDVFWPLNFVGPTLEFSRVPANGTAMHPHLQLSTRESPSHFAEEVVNDFPFNTLQEFTFYTHNSSFGDAFTLAVPQLGGPAKGRSELLGRALVQFGGRCGNTVPIAVACVNPSGVLTNAPQTPIAKVFPGRLFSGPQGFNEFLRFPLRTYALDDLSIMSDPFDISVGAIDLRTGRSVNDVLHRAFINQDLIFALIRVEPRTPQSSFYFRGPLVLFLGPDRRLVLRFASTVMVPFPDGFGFPQPDFSSAYMVGAHSRLDPFLWFRAMQEAPVQAIKSGGQSDVVASTGERFSYSYSIPSDPTANSAQFEYENYSQQGAFRMHSLASVSFTRSLGSAWSPSDYDTISFSGFGIWSKDGVQTVQQVAVQISTSAESPYVGIQIDSGNVSNVNTKPMIEAEALP
jgi:hypothetical protein